MRELRWPEGRPFAFTVFDDPDGQPLAVGREVYALLRDLGFRTTKGVWPLRGNRAVVDRGGTCEEADYRAWCDELRVAGFELGFHNAAPSTSDREQTIRGLERFREITGHDPRAMSQHYHCNENLYWGDRRLTGVHRALYNLATRRQYLGQFRGDLAGDPLFWGDLCATRIRYMRSFVFRQVDTLAACPLMPYHDPERPLVHAWYASTEGAVCGSFIQSIDEARQDELAARGGCCIMYTHFGHGFVERGRLVPRFVQLMTRLAGLGGWLAPVSDVLDHVVATRGVHSLTAEERKALERRWLWHKFRYGSA